MEGSNTASVSAFFCFHRKVLRELLAKVESKIGVREEGFSYARSGLKKSDGHSR